MILVIAEKPSVAQSIAKVPVSYTHLDVYKRQLWELTDLIRLESDLKKHHRAYLHVREDIDEKVKEARQIMTKVSVDMIGFYFKVDAVSYTHLQCAVR